MSGYASQESVVEYSHYKRDKKRLIDPIAASYMIARAIEETGLQDEGFETRVKNSIMAQFILESASEGWEIEFKRVGGLVPGFDNLVGTMWQHQDSGHPDLEAYANLVAHSLGIPTQTGDGR